MRRIVLFACVVLATPALAEPKDDITAADKAFSALSVAKGSNAAFLAYLADDGRLFGTGNEAPIFGKAEAAKRFAKSGNGDPKTNVLSWVPDNVTVSQDGSLGYSDGHWLFAAPKVRLTGHYMTVWRRAGGTWKVIADMGTIDPKKK